MRPTGDRGIMLNGIALRAQAKLITQNAIYDGDDVREGLRNLIHDYLPDVSITFEGEAVPGDFEVEAGIPLFDAVDELRVMLGIIVEWWADGIIIRPEGQGGSLRSLVRG